MNAYISFCSGCIEDEKKETSRERKKKRENERNREGAREAPFLWAPPTSRSGRMRYSASESGSRTLFHPGTKPGTLSEKPPWAPTADR